MTQNRFIHLKSETFYLHKWKNLTKDGSRNCQSYIIFYNETRIQQKLNDQISLELRKLDRIIGFLCPIIGVSAEFNPVFHIICWVPKQKCDLKIRTNNYFLFSDFLICDY